MLDPDETDSLAIVCEACGTEIAPGLLTCPNCHRLVHAEQLKQIAEEAERAGEASTRRPSSAIRAEMISY